MAKHGLDEGVLRFAPLGAVATPRLDYMGELVAEGECELVCCIRRQRGCRCEAFNQREEIDYYLPPVAEAGVLAIRTVVAFRNRLRARSPRLQMSSMRMHLPAARVVDSVKV